MFGGLKGLVKSQDGGYPKLTKYVEAQKPRRDVPITTPITHTSYPHGIIHVHPKTILDVCLRSAFPWGKRAQTVKSDTRFNDRQIKRAKDDA